MISSNKARELSNKKNVEATNNAYSIAIENISSSILKAVKYGLFATEVDILLYNSFPNPKQDRFDEIKQLLISKNYAMDFKLLSHSNKVSVYKIKLSWFQENE